MREQIDTAPVIEAFDSADECPFCYLERMAEQRTVRYVLGPSASYMEPDVRADTDKRGFCREHYQKLYDYGNALGNALIMQTHLAGLLEGLQVEVETLQMPDKRPFFGKPKQDNLTTLEVWLKQQEKSCFVCNRIDYHMRRYYVTWFTLIQDPAFREKVEKGKGCCLRHLAQLLEQARPFLPNSMREWFYGTVPAVCLQNLVRVKADLDHFVEMFDYRNAGADWGNSRDAVSRAMEKLAGLHPADPPYKQS